MEVIQIWKGICHAKSPLGWQQQLPTLSWGERGCQILTSAIRVHSCELFRENHPHLPSCPSIHCHSTSNYFTVLTENNRTFQEWNQILTLIGRQLWDTWKLLLAVSSLSHKVLIQRILVKHPQPLQKGQCCKGDSKHSVPCRKTHRQINSSLTIKRDRGGGRVYMEIDRI